MQKEPVKNRYLLEAYHVNKSFDNVIDDIYNQIYDLTISFKKYFTTYISKYLNTIKYTGYDYNISNKTLIKQEDKSKCKLPIYLRIVVDDGYKFAIEAKKSNKLIINCNLCTLSNIHTKYKVSYLDYDDKEFKRTVKSSLKHELLHVYQQDNDKNFDNKVFKKINDIKEYINNCQNYKINLSEQDKNNIIEILGYCQKTELDACLNGVTEKLSGYTKEFIHNEVTKENKGHDPGNIITDLTLKVCSILVSEESKLEYIQPLTVFFKDNYRLRNFVNHINKKFNIFKNNDILYYLKDYEVKILKQIYYVLHDILKYDSDDSFLHEMFKLLPKYYNSYFYTIYD